MAAIRLTPLFAASTGEGEIRPLTGVRGVAAFIVMLYHYCEYVAFPSFHPFFLKKGYLSVDLFFVLSGFVLALRYGSKFLDEPWKANYWTFLEARFARIYPAYFIISLFYYAKWILNVSGTNTEAYRIQDIVANLLLIQGWGFPVRAVLSDGWSVSVEFFPYFIMPLLAVVMLGRSRWTAVACLVLAVGLLDYIAASGAGVSGPMDALGGGLPILSLLRCFAGFSLGLLAFRVTGVKFVKDILGHSLAAGAVVAAVCLSLWLDKTDVITVCIFPVLVICLYYNTDVSKALFGNRVIHHLGDISFSLYLLHPLFIGIAGRFAMVYGPRIGPWSEWLFLCLGVAATWAASYASFRLIEVPARRFLRLIGPVRRAAVA